MNIITKKLSDCRMTLRELSCRTNIDTERLSQIEGDMCPDITYDELVRIIIGLDTTFSKVSYMLSEDHRKKALKQLREQNNLLSAISQAKSIINDLYEKKGSTNGIISCPRCGSNLHYVKFDNMGTWGKCERLYCLRWME